MCCRRGCVYGGYGLLFAFACVDGKCSGSLCVSDNGACSADGECCGGVCTGGTCMPLNVECKTSGNTCSANSECCSEYCVQGACSRAPSFCAQTGDVCTASGECCGGFCNIADGATLGLCEVADAPGAGGCKTAGEVCGGVYDGGALPTCGGECCSRACLPYGPTGVMICQPPSGCRPTGEICQEDSDCCGGEGNPDAASAGVTCSKVNGNPIGRCDAGNACTPAGGICRLSTISCNENANCCAGNTINNPTCALDKLGIPRCLIAETDCTDPSTREGEECATSADCCGLPCTKAGSGENVPFLCGGDGGGGGCVQTGNTCTTTADCCGGLPCEIETGATVGTCGSDTGECSEYGQTCTETADCCNSVPCTDGICQVSVD